MIPYLLCFYTCNFFSNHKLGGSSEHLGSKKPITVISSEISGDITASGKLKRFCMWWNIILSIIGFEYPNKVNHVNIIAIMLIPYIGL